jgi:hypothetical protein
MSPSCIKEVCFGSNDECLDLLGPWNPAQQGVAWTDTESSFGKRFITARGVCESIDLPGLPGVGLTPKLWSWSYASPPDDCSGEDCTWTEQQNQDVDKDPLCHIGGIDAKGIELWIPFTDFRQTRIPPHATDVDVLKYNATTLTSYGAGTWWSISELEPGDLAGVALHGNDLWGVGYWLEQPAGTKHHQLLQWVDKNFNNSPVRYDISTVDPNALLIYTPYLFITNGKPKPAEPGRIDVYDFGGLKNVSSGEANDPIATYTYDVSGQSDLDHAEGITVRPGTDDELWVGVAGGGRVRNIPFPGVFVNCPACDDLQPRAERTWKNCGSESAASLEFVMHTHQTITGAEVRKGVPYGAGPNSYCAVTADDPDYDDDDTAEVFLKDPHTEVASGDNVTVAGKLCEGTVNQIKFDGIFFKNASGTVICAVDGDGTDVGPPQYEGGNLFRHDITIYNLSGTDRELRNVEAIASMESFGNLGAIEFGGPSHVSFVGQPEPLPGDSEVVYPYITTGSFAGGHVYVRYEISNVEIPQTEADWDLVTFAHPVHVVVPASNQSGRGVLMLALALCGLAALALAARKTGWNAPRADQ